MLKNITFDAKSISLFVGGFVLGNIYGTITTMKSTKKGVTLVKGYIIK